MTRNRSLTVLVGLATLASFAVDASAFYHPGLGRWTSRDYGPGPAVPIGASGPAALGTFIPLDEYSDGMNLYQYVAGNPTGFLDPTGRILFVMSGALRPEKDMTRLKDLTRDAILTEIGPYDQSKSPKMGVQKAWCGRLEGDYERFLRRVYNEFTKRKSSDPCSLEQFVAIGHSSGASAIYNEIRRGTFNQQDSRLAPVYLGMIDRVLPLTQHDLTGALGGLADTLIDDFYGGLRKEPLPGASLSFDVSKGGVIKYPYPDKNGIKGKVAFAAYPNIGHLDMTGRSKEWEIGYSAVLDQIPFRAREAYLRKVAQEQQKWGPPPTWDSSKGGIGW